MIYVVNGKPYIKVANYLKEVVIEKKGKDDIDVKLVPSTSTLKEEDKTILLNVDFAKYPPISAKEYVESKQVKSNKPEMPSLDKTE